MTARRTEHPRLALQAGGALQGTISSCGSPGQTAVLFVHGFGSVHGGVKAEALEAECARREWTLAAFDFRGHGASTGTLLDLRPSGLLSDLSAVRDYLAGRGLGRLFVVGSSMGGWATAWFTLANAAIVPAVAFIAPALEFPRGSWSQLTDVERDGWKRTGRLPVENLGRGTKEELDYAALSEADLYPTADLAARWSRPAVIFHSMRDDVVPHADVLAFAARTACADVELRLFTGGDHRFPLPAESLAAEIGRFFARWW
jgi:pimeloyl-ACP methyl ester carboxylesterase